MIQLSKEIKIPELLPREKLKTFGCDALLDHELLSIVLGTGYNGLSVGELSQQILGEFGTKGLFQFSSLEHLQEQTGLPPVKSMQILAIAEFFRRIQQRDNTKISSSEQLYEYLKPHLVNASIEKLWIVCTDSSRRVLFSGIIAAGDGNIIHVSLAQIFHHPIRFNCKNFFLAHNHPYGKAKASKQDIQLTLAIQEESKKLGLSFDDHIIVGENGFFSFALHGILN